MDTAFQQVLAQALALPKPERIDLVQAILANIKEEVTHEGASEEGHFPWESEAFWAELDRRADDIRSGKVTPIPGEEFMKKLKERRQ